MAAIVKRVCSSTIFIEIEKHIAWKGHISGLVAEKMLRGKNTPFLYIIRMGEHKTGDETGYYITYVDVDLVVQHRPFVITVTPQGWYYENVGGGGPYQSASINDVIHLILHVPEGVPVPFTPFAQMA